MTREPEMRWSRLLPPARAWVPIQETPAALVLYELLVAEGQRRITEAFAMPPGFALQFAIKRRFLWHVPPL